MSHLSRQKREARAAAKAETEERSRMLFAEHNKNKKKKTRKKDSEEIIKLIPNNYLIPSKYVRNPEDWLPKSYNLNKQIISFVQWVYCLYPTPQFLFELFTKKKPGETLMNPLLNQRAFFSWFIAISSGGSFAKHTKEFFTKKEAHLFLNAPSDNTITENVWWVKCKSLNLEHRIQHAVVKQLFRSINAPSHYLELGNLFWWQRLLIILKNCEDEVNVESLSDIMDFLRYRHNNSDAFDLKGRTFNSLIKLSNEWHREMQMKKFGSQNLYWEGVDVPDWEWTSKKSEITWIIKQLHTSKELFNEGKRMRHCVSSYGGRCAEGLSAIFSIMRLDGINAPEKRITVELTKNKQFVQARGRMNKSPEGMDKLVLNKWLSINNIQNNSWGW